ncbi:MAG: radical SAM protein [bacterium]
MIEGNPSQGHAQCHARGGGGKRHTVHHVLGFMRNRLPGQLVLQYTDRCNATCPQCGMRRTNTFDRSKITMETARKIIDAAAQRGIAALSFTGGEPLLFADEIIPLIHYAVEAGIPYVRTGTNGFLFMGAHRPGFEKRIAHLAQALVQSGLYTFWISIDTYDPAVHEKMRGLPGVIEGIRKAVPIFHEQGFYPSANLGINKSIAAAAGLEDITPGNPRQYYAAFREGFRKFFAFVHDLGFTIVNVCYPMSLDEKKDGGLEAVYGATSTDEVVRFTQAERVLVFQALLDTIIEFRSRIRIFSPQCSLYSLIRDYTEGKDKSYPCRGGWEYFFIDARDGNIYPCGYRGKENLGKFWEFLPNGQYRKDVCKACDWECFRDPSEMFGPVLTLFRQPGRFIGMLRQERAFMKLWFQDMLYYAACNFFNGRKAPCYHKMRRFNRLSDEKENCPLSGKELAKKGQSP